MADPSLSQETPGLKVCNSYHVWRYHVDAEYRAKHNERTLNYIHNRRAQDPAYDEKLKQRWRENAKRYSEDPEKRAKKQEYRRKYYADKKAATMPNSTVEG